MIAAIRATARAVALTAMVPAAAWAAFEEPVEVKALVESVIAELNSGYDDPAIRVGGPIAVSGATDESDYDFVVNLPELVLYSPDAGDNLELGTVDLFLADLDTATPRFKFAVPEAMTGSFDGPVSIAVEAGRVAGAWNSAARSFRALTAAAASLSFHAPRNGGLKMTTGELRINATQAAPSAGMIVSRGQGSWQNLRISSASFTNSIEIDKIVATGDQQSPVTFHSSGALADAQARLRSDGGAEVTAKALRDLIGGGHYDKVNWRISFQGTRSLQQQRPIVSIDAMALSGGAVDLSKPTGQIWLDFDVQGLDDKIGVTPAPPEVVPSQMALALRLQDLDLPSLIHSLQPYIAESATVGDAAAKELFRRTLGLHLATAGTRIKIETADTGNDHYTVDSDAVIHWTDTDPANPAADARVVARGLRGLIQALANYQDDPMATRIMGVLGLVTAFGKPEGDPAADKLTYDIEVRPGNPMRINGRAMEPPPKDRR